MSKICSNFAPSNKTKTPQKYNKILKYTNFLTKKTLKIMKTAKQMISEMPMASRTLNKIESVMVKGSFAIFCFLFSVALEKIQEPTEDDAMRILRQLATPIFK